jgi:outer membrane protein
MKTMFKIAAVSAVAFAGAIALPSMASAQVAIADVDQAVGQSNAFVLAENQIKLTHKAAFDQVTAARAELQKLYAVLDTNKDKQVSQPELDAAVAAKRPEIALIDAKNAQVNAAGQPIAKARAYSQEQIVGKLEAALKQVMTTKRLTLILAPQAAVYALPAADVTTDITNALNTLVPQVSITPPANWQPGGAPAAAAGAAPAAPAPAKPAPQGR